MTPGPLGRRRGAQKLVPGELDERGLINHIASIEERVEELERALRATVETLAQRIEGVEDEQRSMLAHTAVVRYDALNESSGHQSSSLAIVDREGRGLVLSSIHQRDQARVYTKPVEDWSSSYPLSPEEERALEAARSRRSGGSS